MFSFALPSLVFIAALVRAQNVPTNQIINIRTSRATSGILPYWPQRAGRSSLVQPPLFIYYTADHAAGSRSFSRGAEFRISRSHRLLGWLIIAQHDLEPLEIRHQEAEADGPLEPRKRYERGLKLVNQRKHESSGEARDMQTQLATPNHEMEEDFSSYATRLRNLVPQISVYSGKTGEKGGIHSLKPSPRVPDRLSAGICCSLGGLAVELIFGVIAFILTVFFWVGFCFWELNGFYSVTGHRRAGETGIQNSGASETAAEGNPKPKEEKKEEEEGWGWEFVMQGFFFLSKAPCLVGRRHWTKNAGASETAAEGNPKPKEERKEEEEGWGWEFVILDGKIDAITNGTQRVKRACGSVRERKESNPDGSG
ncbi:hypothetical protein DFH09DRAFT_1269610 [Mycena vulgaris]|nr:hypothetical protein DFH09DRAFT_1269610 [Mycena vulgaris]